MGAGNSKNVAEKVVKKARPMIKQGTPSDVKTPRTIQANLSRQDIENMSQKAECQGDNNEFLQLEDVVKKPQASGKKTNQIQLLEMKEELLKDFQQFKDFDRVEYLTENSEAFQNTASSHRPRSQNPISKPSDRTSVAASGTFVEKVPGRLMTSEMREFLRLYYENPSTNTTEILIKKYSLEKKVVEDILKNVGPPNVIEPRSKFEYPLGIWHNK